METKKNDYDLHFSYIYVAHIEHFVKACCMHYITVFIAAHCHRLLFWFRAARK